MPSPIVTVTIQAVLFSALSTTLAQCITAYQLHSTPISPKSPDSPSSPWWSTFDLYSLLSFMAIAIIMTPPNYLYARYLEDIFPSKVPLSSSQSSTKHNAPAVTNTSDKTSDPSHRLSKRNTLLKLLLEQLLAAPVNTLLFLTLVNLSKGTSLKHVLEANGEVRKEFWPMLIASWRLWPAVSLGNLVFVPFEWRMGVGNLVGVVWGVYIALRSM